MTTNNNELKIINIKTTNIIEPKYKMRSHFDEGGLNELAYSIKTLGLLNPITVRKKRKKYEIIAGHRRFLAMKGLSWKEIPCIVNNSDDNEMYALRAVENLVREDITPIEEAKYLSRMVKETKLSQKEIALMIGKSEAYISDRMKIANYNPRLYNALKANEINFAVARIFSKINEDDVVKDFLRYAIRGGINEREAKRWVNDWKDQQQRRTNAGQEEETTEPTETSTWIPPERKCFTCKESPEEGKMFVIEVCRSCLDAINDANQRKVEINTEEATAPQDEKPKPPTSGDD